MERLAALEGHVGALGALGRLGESVDAVVDDDTHAVLLKLLVQERSHLLVEGRHDLGESLNE
jgi:hypothetical protein